MFLNRYCKTPDTLRAKNVAFINKKYRLYHGHSCNKKKRVDINYNKSLCLLSFHARP